MLNRRDVVNLFFLLALGLIFWSSALKPERSFFIRDLSAEIVAKRSFLVESKGLGLWNPYCFFGMPEASNPQSEAFYPFNFIYRIFGAERGIVYYVVFHHLFLILTLYLGFRRLGFSENGGMLGAIGFGFGGFMSSLSLLVVLLSTASWMGLLIICLGGCVRGNWLKWGLLLGLVFGVQVLAGEIEIAVMSWVISSLAVLFSPISTGIRSMAKVLGGFLVGLFFGVIFSLPQILLTLEMIPLSNRATGIPQAHSLIWSLKPYALKSLLLPNYIFSPANIIYWGLGFFSGYPYFLSIYLGLGLSILAWFGFRDFKKTALWVWLLVGIFGLLMMMGEDLPFYRLAHQYLPGFKFIRIPIKFLFFLNFSLVMLAMISYDNWQLKSRRWRFVGIFLILSGIVMMLFLIMVPLRIEKLGNQWEDIVFYLALRSFLRVLGFACLFLGVGFLIKDRNRTLVGMVLGLFIFLDFYYPHHHLNATITKDFFSPNFFVRDLLIREQRYNQRVWPVRILSLEPDEQEMIMQRVMDPMEFFKKVRDGLHPFWGLYFRFNDIRAVASFYPSDLETFKHLRANESPEIGRLILARAGVEYLYYRDYGFLKLSGIFPRAMIFYQAEFVSDREQAIDLWSEPNFPARLVGLLEGEEAGEGPAPRLGELLFSEPAEIIEYKNEKVVIKVRAKKEGFLILLDSYYPGWSAYLNGKEVKIFRANGFFRGVRVPAGEQIIEFRYLPKRFIYGIIVSGLGFIFWILALSFSLKKWRKKDFSGSG